MGNLNSVLFKNGLFLYSPKMSKENFFNKLEKKSINVPGDRQGELYKHLKSTGRIKKIEDYIDNCNKAALTKPKVKTEYKLIIDHFPTNSPEHLGFFEGIRERTGLTSIGKSLNNGAGALNKELGKCAGDLNKELGVTKALGWIRNTFIGKDRANRMYKNCRLAISSVRNSTSGCQRALKDDITPSCFRDIPRLAWIKNQFEKEVKQPKEPQICSSIRDFYTGGDMSIGEFRKFHDLQKHEGRSRLGKLWYSCKSGVSGKCTANKGNSRAETTIASPEKIETDNSSSGSKTSSSMSSAGSQAQEKQTSSCWSFLKSSSNPESKKYRSIEYDEAEKNKKKLVENRCITLQELQEKVLSLLSDHDVESGLNKGGVIQELRKEYKSSKIDLLFNAINKKPDIEKKVFLQKLIRKINLSITYPNNHSIAMFINKELQDRKIKQDPSKVTAAIVMVR